MVFAKLIFFPPIFFFWSERFPFSKIQKKKFWREKYQLSKKFFNLTPNTLERTQPLRSL